MKTLIAFLLFVLVIMVGFIVVTNPTSPISKKLSQFVPVQQMLKKAIPAPSADIEELANEATMTDEAKQIFYRAHPVIDTDRAAFNTHCNAPVTGNTVELGCFTTDGHIYLLAITNPELRSEMVVTAAHEMLHAAYQELSNSERGNVDTMVEENLPMVRTRALGQTLRMYQMTEPGERDNELHSILGTEYNGLSSALESYYSQYFTNRSAVVTDANAFDQAFSSIETDLHSLQAQITQIRRIMRQDVRRGDIEAYNALVPQVNSYVDQYNADVTKYNELSRSLIGAEDTSRTQ